MPYPLSTQARERLASGRMRPALLVDIYTTTVRRWWVWPGELSYPANDTVDGTSNVTYSSIEGRMQVDFAVRSSIGLSAEPMTVILDGSRAGDNDDPIGAFVDADWHQRMIRARLVLLDFDTGTSPSDPILDWRGRMDHRSFRRAPGVESQIVITCEGGPFRLRGRRLHTRTDSNQRRRSASDRFFDLTAAMVTRQPVWGKSIVNVPGVRPAPGGGGGIGPPIDFETNDGRLAD